MSFTFRNFNYGRTFHWQRGVFNGGESEIIRAGFRITNVFVFSPKGREECREYPLTS